MAEAKQKKAKATQETKSSEASGARSAAEELSAEEQAMLKDYVPTLKRKYREEVVPAMLKRFGYKNVMQVPRIEKVVVNMGVGEASRDAKLLEAAMNDLALITGQKPKLARAKKSISAFKIRTGMPVGCFVTLRGNRMYEFMERLIRISIPRIRDFRGLPTRSFDGRGNHSMGVREHTIFMELDINKVTTVLGMNITTVTTAKTDEEALELLRLMGFPFRTK